MQTLDALFRERVRRCPELAAFSQFDFRVKDWFTVSWADIALQVNRWQVAFRQQGLVKGDRVAVCFRNSIEWVVFDQAALRLGLVVVPLYTADRPQNIAYVLADSRVKLVLLENAMLWSELQKSEEDLSGIEIALVFSASAESLKDRRLIEVRRWLPEHGQHFERGCAGPDDLASIVYTSGTTGRPKGVMLSHKNILTNAYAGLRSVVVKRDARVLSFLPLSHTLERTVGYYASVMSGAHVTFSRSISKLAEDLRLIKPQVLISVPRIFERLHNKIHQQVALMGRLQQKLFHLALDVGWANFEYQQGRRPWHPKLLLAGFMDRIVGKKIRNQLGGELEVVIVGGASLSPAVAKTFLSFGIPLLQGYGLTESSPVISVNTLAHNHPETIGLPLRGVEVKIMGQDELWVKGDSIMQGYWGLPEATDKAMEGEWLKTGDRAVLDEGGFLRIIGRIKDILVLANGEKVPPLDIETAILRDPVFEQVMVLGEGKSYLSALIVLNESAPTELRGDGANVQLLNRITAQMRDFPGYAKIRKVHVCGEQWSIENGMLTPTLKIKRDKIIDHYQREVDEMYAGHGIHGA